MFDTPVDYETLAQLGSIMGSGGIVVMDEDNCMVDVARYFIEFTHSESCGKCVPCRVGLDKSLRILNLFTRGRAAESDIDRLDEMGRMIRDTSLCGLGQSGGKTFEFIVCESALRYLLCPPQVMAGQLDRLLTVSGLGNVTLGIIPPGVELDVAPMVGYLTVDDVTVVETFTSEDKFTGAESATYDRISAALMAEAVTGDEARRLITAAADSLREGR